MQLKNDEIPKKRRQNTEESEVRVLTKIAKKKLRNGACNITVRPAWNGKRQNE